MEPSELPRTSVVLYRLAIGFVFGSTILSMIFSLWTVINDQGGPVIGSLVFSFIAFLCSAWLMMGLVIRLTHFN